MKTKDIKSIEKKSTLTEKAKILKETILANANALADRILEKAIAKEEQELAWAKRKEQIIAENKKKQLEAAQKKREIKSSKRLELKNKTIPSITSEIEKNQEKLEEQRIKHLAELEENHKKRLEAAKRKAIKKAHHSEVKVEKHTTKAERIEAIKEKKRIGKENYNKEMQRQASEIEADRQGYGERVTKREEIENKRIQMLVERRKKRLEKLQIVELTQRQKTIKDLEHFAEAEKIRLKKKEEKRAKYLTKGGIEIPKVKNKAEARPFEPQKPKVSIEFKKYNIVTARLTDKQTIIDSKPNELICRSTDLSKRMKDYHNAEMKEHEDNYVGTFAYPIDKPEHCVYEMINSKYLTINDKLTSRMAKQKDAKAA